jgi:peptidoglycan hydrolase-like protein with peptidoglycan-binding domain
MSQYPYIKLVVPTALKQYKNGQLAESVLASVKTGGKMYAPVAAQFNKMYDAALAAGFKLKNVGDYRSFQGQLAMFNDRYMTTDTGRVPQVTRKYEGKTWYLKKGKAPSAAPDPTGLKGSNHGWGLAIDLGYDNGGKLTSMGGACFAWMCANAPKYGFYLQGSDPKSKEFEAWHWQYALGDSSPDGSVQVSAEALKPSGGAVEAGPMVFAYPGTPVRLGSKGASAMLVQAVIGAKADGDFGPKSVASLKAWQTANGLTADGSVGPVTWKKMFG